MALLDICSTSRDSTNIVERPVGTPGTVLDIDVNRLTKPVVQLVLTGGGGSAEVSYTFQS